MDEPGKTLLLQIADRQAVIEAKLSAIAAAQVANDERYLATEATWRQRLHDDRDAYAIACERTERYEREMLEIARNSQRMYTVTDAAHRKAQDAGVRSGLFYGVVRILALILLMFIAYRVARG